MEDIKSVSNYREFLDRIGCSYTPAEMTTFLRNGVRGCCAKHYGGMKVNDIIGNSSMEVVGSPGTGEGMDWEEVLAAATPDNMKAWRMEYYGKWKQHKQNLKKLKAEKARQDAKTNHTQNPSSQTGGGGGTYSGHHVSRNSAARGKESRGRGRDRIEAQRSLGSRRVNSSVTGRKSNADTSRADSDQDWRRK